jgi:hypothetical protein
MKLFDFFMTLVFGFALFISIFLFGAGIGYKTGQIDAINGQVHYHLEKQSNDKMEWVSNK